MTPDDVTVYINGDTATVRHADVDGLGDFVNMRNTPNFWHMDFPTLYPPVLHNGVWSYYGQPNTNRATRDLSLNSYPSWHKWNMWRSGGRPAKHPPLIFVLANKHYKHQLFGQGHACLDTESTVDASMHGPGSSGNTFSKRLCHFAANVRGTDQYWKSMGSNFCATAFFHSRVH
jgi:hypothetical protein